MNKNIKKFHQDIDLFLTKKFKTYFDCEFNYIECPEDLEDLELALCSDELLEETFNEVMSIINDSEDAYDIEILNQEEFEEDIRCFIDDVFYKTRDEEVEIWREKFEMEDMVSEIDEYGYWQD